MDSKVIWNRFIKSGRVEDYLLYKKSLDNKAEAQDDGDFLNEDEYGRSDIEGTEYW